jgi:hypothetical protein
MHMPRTDVPVIGKGEELIPLPAAVAAMLVMRAEIIGLDVTRGVVARLVEHQGNYSVVLRAV